MIAEVLAVGLITGATRSYEEVYASNHNEEKSPYVYEHADTTGDDALSVVELAGFGDAMTAITFIYRLAVGERDVCCLSSALYQTDSLRTYVLEVVGHCEGYISSTNHWVECFSISSNGSHSQACVRALSLLAAAALPRMILSGMRGEHKKD